MYHVWQWLKKWIKLPFLSYHKWQVLVIFSVLNNRVYNYYCVIHILSLVLDSVLIDLFLKRTCEVQLEYNETICNAVGKDSPEGHLVEKLVQPVAAEYMMWKMILESVVPAVMSLFLGTWSDTNGRKPVIVCPLIGEYFLL